jgi:large subunit ribosomal protein L25
LKGLVKDIPEFIEINISKLGIGDSIKVKDLKIDKITMLSPANAVIVGVKTARVIELDEEESEEGAEGEEAKEGDEAEAPKE